MSESRSNDICLLLDTYLCFSFEADIYNIFELLDLILSYVAKLVSELTVFVNKVLNNIHLLIQLIELGIGESLSIR